MNTETTNQTNFEGKAFPENTATAVVDLTVDDKTSMQIKGGKPDHTLGDDPITTYDLKMAKK
jgi:hypothetical protein